MISYFGLLAGSPGSREDLADHWHALYETVVGTVPGLRRFAVNVVHDANTSTAFPRRGSQRADGIVELVFDDLRGMRTAWASESATGGMSGLLDGMRVLTAVKKLDRDPRPAFPETSGLVKQITFLRRRHDAPAAVFQEEWWGEHSRLVSHQPGHVGYAQNLVIDRTVNGESVPHADLPIDGVVEAWFASMAGVQECYSSPEYEATKDLDQICDIIRIDDHVVYADAGYQGVQKRPEIAGDEHYSGIEWRIAARKGVLKSMPEHDRRVESGKAGVRAKVEHPFLVIKRDFGFVKTRYRGMAKNRHHLQMLFASANWLMRGRAVALTPAAA